MTLPIVAFIYVGIPQYYYRARYVVFIFRGAVFSLGFGFILFIQNRCF